MSFILDALRKSETERQRLSQVAIADLPVGRRRRGQPWWVFALSGLLVLNLIVLAAVLLKNRSARDERAATQPAMMAPAPTPATATPAYTPPAPAALNDNALQTAVEPPQIEYETITREQYEMETAAASIPDGPRLVRSTGDYGAAPPAQVAPYAADADNQLQLNLHVYSRDANARFVMINMRRYGEGQRLPNGATVEQITPEGVIIYQNGQRYQLNRS